MKKVLLIAGVLILVSAPLHAYVSSGTLIGGQPLVQSTTTTTDPAVSDGTDPVDPSAGFTQVEEPRLSCPEPSHPVPEPGTMAITSIGLLAAAALRKKRAR